MRVFLVVAIASLAVVSAEEASWTQALAKLTGLSANTPAPSVFTPSPGGIAATSAATYYGDSQLTGNVTHHCHCVGCEGAPFQASHFTIADVGKYIRVHANGDVQVGVDPQHLQFRQINWTDGATKHLSTDFTQQSNAPNYITARIRHVTDGIEGKVELDRAEDCGDAPGYAVCQGFPCGSNVPRNSTTGNFEKCSFDNPLLCRNPDECNLHRHYLSPANSPEQCAIDCENDPKCLTSMFKADGLDCQNYQNDPAKKCQDVKCFKYYHQVESVECTGAAIYTCYQKPVQCVASVLPADHTEGANDIFRGWYDVQRCGKTNDYCFWDGASGGEPQMAKGGVNGNNKWKCRMGGQSASDTPRDAAHWNAAQKEDKEYNKHGTSTSYFPYKRGASDNQTSTKGGWTPRTPCDEVFNPPPPTGSTRIPTIWQVNPTWPPYLNTQAPSNTRAPTGSPGTHSPTCDDTCSMETGVDYHGNDIQVTDHQTGQLQNFHGNVSDSTACCALCHLDVYCHWWTYATSNADDTDSNTEGEYGGGRNKNCWLKNSFAGNETQNNRDSGGSGCWQHTNGTSQAKPTAAPIAAYWSWEMYWILPQGSAAAVDCEWACKCTSSQSGCDGGDDCVAYRFTPYTGSNSTKSGTCELFSSAGAPNTIINPELGPTPGPTRMS